MHPQPPPLTAAPHRPPGARTLRRRPAPRLPVRAVLAVLALLAAALCVPGGAAAAAPAAAAGTFTNPVREGAADPYLTWTDGQYYLTYTQGDHVGIVSSPTLAGLHEAPEHEVFRDATPDRCCNFWAPELHKFGDRWYLYYGADNGDIGQHRIHVLEGGADPLDPYTYKGELNPGDYNPGIDSTVLEVNGAAYLMWSGWDPDGQDLFLAKMASPWELTGPRSKISVPTHDWELTGGAVNEGPAVLQHDGRTFIAFSASQCHTPDYKLGLLTLVGADPLDPAAWSKSEQPVFTRNDAAGVFGPGHNSFFTSPDGTETYNAYHATADPAGSCGGDRSLRVQKVDWRADGTPDFGTPAAPGTPLPTPAGE
ncbi:glycoside hydrolase family 43 protein [Streptomyces sp. NPDC049954]|uniref:glycoside hydrolase family 43 protein n=1 Tax=Streptomyces sp. NPDC049954 TaxID=3155779 RepID=UPI00342C31EF